MKGSSKSHHYHRLVDDGKSSSSKKRKLDTNIKTHDHNHAEKNNNHNANNEDATSIVTTKSSSSKLLNSPTTESKQTTHDTNNNNTNNTNNTNKNPNLQLTQTKEEQHKQNLKVITEERKKLPIYPFRAEICRQIKNHEVLLIVAETGSGKSTQIPSFLFQSGSYLQNPTTNARSSSHNRQRKMKLAKTICITQPRRVAAMTVSSRVAMELDCTLGSLVGYRVRFDDCTDIQGQNTTRIIYATDGMLLREATMDPLLSRYAVVILDEAHERSMQTDILFGVVKRAMDARNVGISLFCESKSTTTTNTTANTALTDKMSSTDNQTKQILTTKDELIKQSMKSRAQQLELPPLRVIVMSATLDIDTFSKFFSHTSNTLLQIPGRLHPVQTLYTSTYQEDYIDSALSTAMQIHKYEEDDGDILIFLPGQEEIESLLLLLKKNLNDQEQQLSKYYTSNTDTTTSASEDIVQNIQGIGKDLNSGSSFIVNRVLVCALYAALTPSAQMLAFQPKPKGCIRKIILATNIAETSVTLDGIRYVIDTGKFKTRDFSGTATGMESLKVADVSKAQANQRTGRAGRVMAGVCFRLYPEIAFDELQETTTPEILRVNLAQVTLQLKGMGIHDPRTFDFLTPPDTKSLMAAFEQLYALNAIDSEMNITSYGKKMAKLPLDPTYANFLLQSSKYECTSDVLTAVAMISAENIFYRPSGNGAGYEDDGNNISSKAAAAHRRFFSYEGDLPTMLHVYQSWNKEAICPMSNDSGGNIMKKKMMKKYEGKGLQKISHIEWCNRNFINGRSLVRARDVRNQLLEICSREENKNGLGMNVKQSCGDDNMEQFLKCACAGLFLQVASRSLVSNNNKKGTNNNKQSNNEPKWKEESQRGKYKTKIGGCEVSIHPMSSLFGRNPAPKCVVYTELIVTKRTYIRGVTQVREEWLSDVAPSFFKPISSNK